MEINEGIIFAGFIEIALFCNVRGINFCEYTVDGPSAKSTKIKCSRKVLALRHKIASFQLLQKLC